MKNLGFLFFAELILDMPDEREYHSWFFALIRFNAETAAQWN